MSVKSREKARFFRSYERIMQGGKRKGAASGESSVHFVKIVVLPTTPHLLLHLYHIHISLFSFYHCQSYFSGKWGPFPQKEANRGIPPLNPPSSVCSYKS